MENILSIIAIIIAFAALILSQRTHSTAKKELKETIRNNLIIGNIKITKIELNIISFSLDIFKKNRYDATNPKNRNRSETTIGEIMESDCTYKTVSMYFEQVYAV